MEKPPIAFVETEQGYLTVICRVGCVPVPVAAKLEKVSRNAIYDRINRGAQSYYSVFGQQWVVPRPLGELPSTQEMEV